jgi:hypothetical protein
MGFVMTGRNPSGADAPMRIGLSRRQRDLVLREVPAPEHLRKLVRVAGVEGSYFQIRLTMEQLDELLDCIEDRAN